MSIVLCQADQRFSGPNDDLPPDMMAGGGGPSYNYSPQPDMRGRPYDDDRSRRSRRSRRNRSNSSSSSSSGSRKHRRCRKKERFSFIGGLVGSIANSVGGQHQQGQYQQGPYQQGPYQQGPYQQGPYQQGYPSRSVESRMFSSDKWRLVVCYWDGYREVL